MHSDKLPHMAYDICGQRWVKDAPGFADAIADAHAARRRPRCLCVPEGVEMYIARLAGLHGGYIVKRMPDTGYRHAPDCQSYELSADTSGLGQLLGTAIEEDPTTGETSLRLGFSLTKMPGSSQTPQGWGESESVSTEGTKLSLRGLLHYLWDQAELTKWHPGFAGKRTWGTVRRQLLSASAGKFAHGDPLLSRLYIPETFIVEDREAIFARRSTQWLHVLSAPAKPQKLMLLIGEAKEIGPARYGFSVVMKHVPDLSFAIDGHLYRRLVRRFETDLTLWSASQDCHMVIIATFAVAVSGAPIIIELSMMPVTRNWLPFANQSEQLLLELLVQGGRSFVKVLRYNLVETVQVAAAVLTDCSGSPEPLFVTTADQEISPQFPPGAIPTHSPWTWNSSNEAMPALPQKQARRRQFSSVPA
jgi:hypothetical protein